MDEGKILAALNVGTAKDAIENKSGSLLGQLLVGLTQEVVEELQIAMANRNINTASMGLSQSTKPTEVTLSGSEVSVGISMEFYWKFINFGVNGTEINRGAPQWGSQPNEGQSFKQAIGQWIPQRGIALPEQFQTYDQFQYAIMTNLRKHGIKPRPFFDDVINPGLVKILQTPIEKVLGRAIQLTIAAPFK